MVCYAAQNNLLRPVEGNSGVIPSCVTTSTGFFIGDGTVGKRIEVKTGERFRRLTIIKEAEKRAGKRYFLCKCDCGNIQEVRFVAMRADKTKSCGCMRNERNRTANLTHGMAGTRLYNSWHSMKQRCLNQNAHGYKFYGERGIKVCKEWMEFKAFCKWALANGYKEGLSIERINCNGNYEPVNCTWATASQQDCNTRRSKRITYRGKTQVLSQWAEELKLDYKMLQRRLSHGWSVEKAFNTPLQTKYSFKKVKTA